MQRCLFSKDARRLENHLFPLENRISGRTIRACSGVCSQRMLGDKRITCSHWRTESQVGLLENAAVFVLKGC